MRNRVTSGEPDPYGDGISEFVDDLVLLGLGDRRLLHGDIDEAEEPVEAWTNVRFAFQERV